MRNQLSELWQGDRTREGEASNVISGWEAEMASSPTLGPHKECGAGESAQKLRANVSLELAALAQDPSQPSMLLSSRKPSGMPWPSLLPLSSQLEGHSGLELSF